MTIEEIRKEVKRRLTEPRYQHSCLTAKIAVCYAKRLGYDAEKTEIAALLHDIAREYTDEENEEAIQKYQIRINQFSRDFIPNLHGLVGAAVAEHEFGITDPEILDAIRNHVTGRPFMKPVEEMIYAADHVSKLKDPREIEEFEQMDLERAIYTILRRVIQFDVLHGKKIDSRTQMTFDWYLEKIESQTEQDVQPLDAGDLREIDQAMDELLELYQKHLVPISHVRNLRDLGGYATRDGKKIRKKKIFRSGNLDKFTPEDYQKLADCGINYVVDLRHESEKAPGRIKEFPGIHFVSIPFVMQPAEDQFYQDIEEKYQECKDPEEMAWVVSRYFLAFNMDELYGRIMADVESCEKIKQILRCMLAEDCTGVLIFCQSGKDRTGIVVSILLCLLGVDPKVILQDYELSGISYYAVTLNYFETLWTHKYNQTVLSKVIDVMNIDEERVRRLNDQVLKYYSNYGQYLDPIFCFQEGEELQFKNKFLE